MITYSDAYIKLQYRLNKSATEDYSNLDHDPASEAINKAYSDWFRRTLHGGNLYKEGAEESRMRVDDLQPFLVPLRKMALTNGGIFSETGKLPKDYRYFNRFSFFDRLEGCKKEIVISSDLREEANVDVLLSTDATKPSKKFEQSFHTLIGNKIRLYHNGEFNPVEGLLTYYKSPKVYNSRNADEVFEVKDDVVEQILDEAAKIIAGDTDNTLQYQRADKSVESNN